MFYKIMEPIKDIVSVESATIYKMKGEKGLFGLSKEYYSLLISELDRREGIQVLHTGIVLENGDLIKREDIFNEIQISIVKSVLNYMYFINSDKDEHYRYMSKYSGPVRLIGEKHLFRYMNNARPILNSLGMSINKFIQLEGIKI